MDERELRLECLKQAMIYAPLKWPSFKNYHIDSGTIVSVAERFEKYVLSEVQNDK